MTDRATIQAAVDALADEFDLIGDAMDPERYRHLMDLGRGLSPLTDAERTDLHRVRGCASQVWLVIEDRGDGRLHFRGDSDSDIVRGLVAVLVQLLDGREVGAVASFDLRAAFDRLGFAGALSTQRSNGFFSMVQRLQGAARASAGPVSR